jgi:RNA polymerase sigma factor (sigma-70 family)
MSLEETTVAAADIRALYTRYGYLLQRRARVILRDPELAADAVQEAFLKAFRAQASLQDVEAPLAWLYRVLDRTCLDMLRRRKLQPSALSDAHPESASAHPELQLNERDFALKMLKNVDEASQQLALMAFVDGMSQQQIGDELGLSRVTINKRIGVLRTQLIQFLECGYALSNQAPACSPSALAPTPPSP